MVDWQSRYTPYKSKPGLSYILFESNSVVVICCRIRRRTAGANQFDATGGESLATLTSGDKLISRTPLGRRDNFPFFVCSRQILYMSSLKRQQTWEISSIFIIPRQECCGPGENTLAPASAGV